MTKITTLLLCAAAAAMPLARADYWVSSTGKVHNQHCRYYGKGNGYRTESPRGQNCKVCGGAGSQQSSPSKNAKRPKPKTKAPRLPKSLHLR